MNRLSALFRRVGLSKPWSDFPAASEINAERRANRQAAPLPEREFMILFTPRSGSSMLSDLARRTGVLGKPNELFNPNHIAKIALALDATSLPVYCDVARRSQQRGGTFGFKIAYPQLGAVFPNEESFLKVFPDPNTFWLIREDIVLQAISLYKMQRTQLAHSPSSSAEERAAREAAVVYDAAAIQHWLMHIRRAEEATEALIARAGYTPLRMSYERNIALKPNQLANVMVRHVGLRTMRLPGVESAHEKIGTDLNEDFAERFRAEQAAWLAPIADARAPMLEQIIYYGPQNPDKKKSGKRRSKAAKTRRKRQ